MLANTSKACKIHNKFLQKRITSMAKKTLKVIDLINLANGLLKHTEDDKKEFRQGVQMLLEQALLKNGSYNGYYLLDSDDMKDSVSGLSVGRNKVGIDVLNTDSEKYYREVYANTDNTRVMYVPVSEVYLPKNVIL